VCRRKAGEKGREGREGREEGREGGKGGGRWREVDKGTTKHLSVQAESRWVQRKGREGGREGG